MLSDLIRAFTSGSTDDLKWAVAGLLLSLPIIILALSVHETAHGWLANRLGDPTAKNMGRLTLNPLKHLDPIGFICMLLFGFGFAKPVPVESRYFKKPRRDMALTAAAGPISNILLGFIFAVLLRILTLVIGYIPITAFNNEFVVYLLSFSNLLLQLGVRMNISLAVFNLIPVPPLDGSKILYIFLPPKWYYKALQYERYIYFALLLLLFAGVLTPVISFLTDAIISLFSLILFF